MSSNGQQQFWLHSDQKDGSNSDWTNIIPTLNDGHAMTSVSGAQLKKIVIYRLEDPQISSWRSSIFTIDNDLHSNHNRQAGLTYKGHFTFFGLAPGSDYEVNLTTKYKSIKLLAKGKPNTRLPVYRKYEHFLFYQNSETTFFGDSLKIHPIWGVGSSSRILTFFIKFYPSPRKSVQMVNQILSFPKKNVLKWSML